jgi:hypothetical protein
VLHDQAPQRRRSEVQETCVTERPQVQRCGAIVAVRSGEDVAAVKAVELDRTGGHSRETSGSDQIQSGQPLTRARSKLPIFERKLVHGVNEVQHLFAREPDKCRMQAQEVSLT